MMQPKRILITGSRCWPRNVDGWEAIINPVIQRLPPNTMIWPQPGQPRCTTILIYGDCPTGVDHIIHDWGRQMRNQPNRIGGEQHHAYWVTEGPAAGPNRNQRMVNSGADVCLGFPHGQSSRGTLDCMVRAMAAEIPTFVTELGEPGQWRTRPVDSDLLARLCVRYR